MPHCFAVRGDGTRSIHALEQGGGMKRISGSCRHGAAVGRLATRPSRAAQTREKGPWWPNAQWGAADAAGGSNWITPDKVLKAVGAGEDRPHDRARARVRARHAVDRQSQLQHPDPVVSHARPVWRQEDRLQRRIRHRGDWPGRHAVRWPRARRPAGENGRRHARPMCSTTACRTKRCAVPTACSRTAWRT